MKANDEHVGFDEAFKMMRRLDALCSILAGDRVKKDIEFGDTVTQQDLDAARVEYFALYKKIATIIAHSVSESEIDEGE